MSSDATASTTAARGETTPLLVVAAKEQPQQQQNTSTSTPPTKQSTLWAARFARLLQKWFPQSYGAYASLDQSWYNFEYYVLPRRVRVAATSVDGGTDGGSKKYAKAVVGQQLDDSFLYPAWTTPVRQLSEFGTGIAVYFETLLALTVILFVAGLLYLPTIYYYASGDGYKQDGGGAHTTLTGPVRASLICPEPIWVPCIDCTMHDFADNPVRLGHAIIVVDAANTTILTFAQKNVCAPLSWRHGGINHLVVMVFVILSIFALGRYLKRLELTYDESVLTASDYTIQVDNPPADATDPDEWHAFYETSFGPVAFVTVALDNSDLLDALSRRRSLLQRAIYSVQQQQRQNETTTSTSKQQQQQQHLEQEKLPQKLAGGILAAKIEAITDECHELLQRTYPTSAVFVTFETERAQRAALAALNVGHINIVQNNIHVLPPAMRFRGQFLLDVFEAPEPSAIRWPDLDETFCRKLLQRIVSGCFWAAVVTAGFYIVHLAFQTDVNLAATVIAVLNIVMPLVFKKINTLESHQSESTYQASLYWKIAVFRWINTGIITILIVPNTLTLADTANGLVQAVYAVLKAEIITAPVLHMLDIVNNIKRLVVAPFAKNQAAMNAYFRGSQQSLGEKYTNTTKTLFLVFFYCAIFPASFFFGAAALFLTYVTDKYMLLRSWGRLPALGDDVARLGRKVFFPLTAVALAIMSEFFVSAYPCDNLCDTDTVVGEQSSYVGSHAIRSATAASAAGDNAAADGTSGLLYSARVEVGDTLYRFCDQNFLVRLDTLFDFFFAEKDDWMKGDQQSMSFVFGLFAVSTTVIMLILNVRSDIKHIKSDALGGYATTERDSGKPFQSIKDMQAYIPQIPNADFSFPLIGADLSTFNGKYVGWHDHLLDYEFYDLSRDVKVLLGDSSTNDGDNNNHNGNACRCLSQVKQYF